MLCKMMLFSERRTSQVKPIIYNLTVFKILFDRHLQFV